jgi:transposase
MSGVSRLGTITDELKQLVAWLVELKISTVAWEAASVQWIPLAELLEGAKIEVCLVNPRRAQHPAYVLYAVLTTHKPYDPKTP